MAAEPIVIGKVFVEINEIGKIGVPSSVHDHLKNRSVL
jgi:hypothetical protein